MVGNEETYRVTPDAVLHRYQQVVSAPAVDTAALFRLIATDADLLNRWVTSLGTAVDPDAITRAMHQLEPDSLAGMARAQIWSVVPLGNAARLGFDQWRGVLLASCVAEALVREVGYPFPDSARLRTLLASSGVQVADDALMSELGAFRGVAPELLADAHPLLRAFAVAESLEHHSSGAAARVASILFGLDGPGFDRVLDAAERRCATLIESAGIVGDVDDSWLEALWVQAQLSAFSNVLAQQADGDSLHEVAALVTRSLFRHVPRCFFRSTDALIAVGDDDLAALKIPLQSMSSIARVWRDQNALTVDDDIGATVVDRQILRRLDTDRMYVAPLSDGESQVGILAFRLSDEDPAEALLAMNGYAIELGRWLGALQRDDERRLRLLRDYQASHEKRLREIVHEANNPLSIIHNYLHILELRLKDYPETHEQLRLIAAEIRRTAAIFKRVVEFPPLSVSVPDKPDVNAQRIDLNDIVRNVVELSRGRAESARVVVTLALFEGGVPVVSDRDRIIQVMTNLIRNAIEAMSEGGALHVATFSGVYRAGRAGVEFSVRDEGPGLPPVVLERLYEPKTSSKGGNHAGLGLHITARLVAELEGAIDVRTAVGRGTAFSVFLPNLEV
jgi:signal transduction histidine kinase